MLHPKEFVPEWLRDYVKLTRAKLRHREAFIGTPHIGSNVRIGKGCSVSRGVELGNGVSLGDFSYVNCGAIVGSAEIGRFCSIGPYAVIGMPEHPLTYLSTSPKLYGLSNVFGDPPAWDDFPAPPEIGSDVWIGAHAFVKQGIRIGHGAVVAAGAVVTRDVEPYAIVGGVPAKVIRLRFARPAVDELLADRWWELEPEQLASRRHEFHHAIAGSLR